MKAVDKARSNRRDLLKWVLGGTAVAAIASASGLTQNLDLLKETHALSRSENTVQQVATTAATPTLGMGSAVSVLPASYVVYIDSTKAVKALNGTTGALDFSSMDAYTVIQGCINALTRGGLIHLAGNTTFVLSQSLTFRYGKGSHYKEVILEGEGVGTELAVTNSGQNAITISNGTNVTVRNLYVSMSIGTGSAIYGSSSGADSPASVFDGRIDNIIISGGGGANRQALIELTNPIDFFVGHIHIFCGASGVRAIHVNVDSNGMVNYGNAVFEYIEAYVTAADAIVIESNHASHLLNLCHFLYMTLDGASVSNNTGLRVGANTSFLKFNYLDIEGFKYGVHVGGTSGRAATANTFEGGYVQAENRGGACIWNDADTLQSTFRNIFLDPYSGAYHILDNSSEGPNETLYDNNRCYSTSPSISYTNHPVFRGAFNAVAWTEKAGTATISSGSNTVTLKHFCAGTPSVVFASGQNPETASIYARADATNLYITVPSNVTAKRTISWSYQL